MKNRLNDDMFCTKEDAEEYVLDVVVVPKHQSKMRQIEAILEEKALQRDLDDYADDEPIGFPEFDETYYTG